MSWALVVFLLGQPLPRVTWFPTYAACQEARERLPEDATATCESHRIPPLAPMTGDLLR